MLSDENITRRKFNRRKFPDLVFLWKAHGHQWMVTSAAEYNVTTDRNWQQYMQPLNAAVIVELGCRTQTALAQIR